MMALIHRWNQHPLARSIPILLLVVISLAVHGLVLAAILEQFSPEVLHFKGSDQATYLAWGKEIAAGDWLSRERGVFYFSPLYPYLLDLLFWLTGSGSLWIGIGLNVLAGVGAALFAALIARRLFGPLAGVVAGVALVLNGSQVALEGMLLNDNLLPALLLAALWLFMKLEHQADVGEPLSARLAYGTGALLGLSILARTSNLLPALALWLVLAWRLRRRHWLDQWALWRMALPIVLLVLLPIGRNGLLYDTWSITSNGPFNFYIGNYTGASGVFDVGPALQESLKQIESAGDWLPRLWADIAENPGHLLWVFGKKCLFFFTSWDAPDNWNYYFTRSQVSALRLLTLDPWLLYALGYAGLLLTWSQRSRLTVLYLFAATFALSIIVVFVSGRYKLPFHGVLAILAGGGVATAWHGVRQWRQPLRLGVAFLGLLPVVQPRPMDGLIPKELFPLRANEYINLGSTYAENGDYTRALELLEPFLATSPVYYGEVAVIISYISVVTGQPEKAANLMDQVVRTYRPPKPEIGRKWLELRVQALASFDSGPRLQEALNQLLAIAPDHPFKQHIPALTGRR